MEINNQFLDINNIKPNNFDKINSDTIKDNPELKKVCNDFEAFFMNQLLEVSMKSSKIAGEGSGSEIFKGMYTDALSQNSSGSLGISEMLFNFLSEKKT
jgi:peptidoglycan hydrolase FlgJ